MEWWTLILTVLAGAIGVCYFVYRRMNHFKRKGIPYIKATPLLGNMEPIFLRKLSLSENVQRLYNIHPDVKYVGVFDFENPVVMLRDPELIKSVTIKNFDNFQDHKNFLDKVQDSLFAKTLFSLQGERWRDMRSLLSPAFTPSKMKMMYKLVSDCGAELADYLTEKASQPIDIEMKDAFTRYTNDVIASTAFGISVNSLKDRENEFYTMSKEATNLSGFPTFKIFLLRSSPILARIFNIQITSDKIREFFSHVIESTIAMRDEKKIVRNDMIQLMMQARDNSEKIKLTPQDMTAQAFEFLMGGFDASSTIMCFATHEVGINPAVQEKLQAEIDAVLADGDGEVTYEALHSMQYLDAVINETLRLYPTVGAMERMCNKAFELPPAAPGFAPFTVEVGTSIWLPAYAMHRDPQYFPDPDKFDPERFSAKNKGSVPTFAYFPFGIGPRSCIGSRFALMEVKVALFHLFTKCNLSPCSKTSIPMKLDVKNLHSASQNGYWLTVQRRS